MNEPTLGGVEEQHRLLMECVTDYAIFLLDTEGRIATWNAGAQRILGYPEAEVIGRPASLFFTPEDVAAGVPDEELHSAAQTGRAANDRWQVKKDGVRFWASGITTALRDEHDHLKGFAKVLRDLTERKLAEDRLREETLVAETLNRLGGLLAAELDLDRLVQLVTDEAVGLTHAEFGAFFYNLKNERGESYTLYTLSGAPREAFERFPMPRNTAVFEPTFRGQGVVRLDDVTADPRYGKNAPHQGMPAGHLPVKSYLAVPVVSRSGEVLGGLFFGHSRPYVFTARDEKLVAGLAGHAAVAIDNARLHRQAREQAEALREADRRKNEWLAMLAHELRGPLSPVSSAVQVLVLKGPDEPELQRAGEVIARQTGHLARIVEGLLEVTRLIRGEVRLQKERLDLARLVRTAAEDHRPVLAGAGLALVVQAPETPVWVNGDVTRLSQVLGNLLDNAVKFRDGGDRVEVSVRADPDHKQAVLNVRDRGVGIEPELLPVLFDVFAQADRSLNRSGGGLGLGLSVCKGLVALHGGEIRAASAGPGRGAEFTVLLPLEKEPAALSAAPSQAAAQEALRILVVEDNRDSADSLQLLLSLLGHDVRVAYNGHDGVAAAAAWAPDVIISDIGLPGLDGYAVAGELRRHPATANARLIALTGYGAEEDRQRALQSGFDYHLTKPADPAELQRLLTLRV